jgi:hypothetical protein
MAGMTAGRITSGKKRALGFFRIAYLYYVCAKCLNLAG